MRVHVGCEFVYRSALPTPSVLQVEPRLDADHTLVTEAWRFAPSTVTSHTYRDSFGNTCRRVTLPAGECTLRYDADVDVSDAIDPIDVDALELPPEALPDKTLVFTMPSRLCPSDQLAAEAWARFGRVGPGWPRVQAICDWVHGHLEFGYGSSQTTTTALDVFNARRGVCRDFAHLAITMCRAFNIPTRYAFGYLPDVGVPPPDQPMDFCAWMEVFLGDRWWTFDPRNNQRRAGRVLIGRGRDAIDVAMVTSFGLPTLERMTVWADATAVGAPS